MTEEFRPTKLRTAWVFTQATAVCGLFGLYALGVTGNDWAKRQFNAITSIPEQIKAAVLPLDPIKKACQEAMREFDRTGQAVSIPATPKDPKSFRCVITATHA
jgi:hypothetical protein